MTKKLIDVLEEQATKQQRLEDKITEFATEHKGYTYKDLAKFFAVSERYIKRVLQHG